MIPCSPFLSPCSPNRLIKVQECDGLSMGCEKQKRRVVILLKYHLIGTVS